MIRAVLHWRAGHITDEGARQLAEACAAHPGPNPLEARVGHARLRLGVSVDGSSHQWRAAARAACDPALTIRLVEDEPNEGGTDG